MPTLPILLGLLSALTWGAADFGGGLTTKRTSALGVVLGSHLISLVAFLVLAISFNERFPPLHDWLFALAAGLAGGIGLMLLYRALAEGKMSVAAPVSALVAAAIPVFVASLNDLGLPLSAGVTFGLFFVLLHQASGTTILWPIVAARIGSLTGLLGYARLKRQGWIPSRELGGWLAFIGLIDAAGTACYALSARLGRLDVAAVLGSLYPGATVLLAWVFLKERISRLQVFGILLALGAIVMLTL